MGVQGPGSLFSTQDISEVLSQIQRFPGGLAEALLPWHNSQCLPPPSPPPLAPTGVVPERSLLNEPRACALFSILYDPDPPGNP